MKNSLFTLLLLNVSSVHANSAPSSLLTQAIERVESERQKTVSALNSMVKHVDTARKDTRIHQNSISTKIIKTHTISVIAKSTAAVEIAKQ